MTTTTRGRSQDRKLVAGGQEHEVRHEAKTDDVSPTKVRNAVKTVGNRRKAVRAELGGSK